MCARFRPLTVAVAMLAVAAPALAQTVYSLSGSARYEAANLPHPLTFNPPPNGPVLAVPGATALQTSGPDPRRLTLLPGRLTAPGSPVNLPLAFFNPAVFQLQTSVAVQLPATAAVLRAFGRTGPQTVTFCPGQTATVVAGINPMCTSPGAPGNTINGLIRYTRTGSQFGGAAIGVFSGRIQRAFRGAATAPCDHLTTSCVAVFASSAPPRTRVAGGAFGVQLSTLLPPPSPGRFDAKVATNGAIISLTPTGMGGGVAHSWRAFGGPWTTGRVTVSVTTILSGMQVYVLSGSDNRVSGSGSLSLVSGAVAFSSLSGPSAHRGWLTLTLPEPSVPSGLVAGLAALIALAGLRRSTRRRSSRSRPGRT